MPGCSRFLNVGYSRHGRAKQPNKKEPNNRTKRSQITEQNEAKQPRSIDYASVVPANSDAIQHTGTGRFAWVLMRSMSLYESGGQMAV